MCGVQQSLKAEARVTHRDTQLDLLGRELKGGMASTFVRSSVLGALDYVPKKQITDAFPITRVGETSTYDPATGMTSGTADYLLTKVVDGQELARADSGSWVSSPHTEEAGAITFEFSNIWADDLGALIASTLPGMVTVSQEFHRGTFVSGTAHYRTLGGIIAIFGESVLIASAPEEYRLFLTRAAAEGVSEVRDDQFLSNSLSATLVLLEYEAFDGYTGRWVWTPSLELLSTDPVVGNDAELCSAFFPPTETPEFSIRAVRWAGTVTSDYIVTDGVGAWAPGEFSPPTEEAPPVVVSWGAPPTIVDGEPPPPPLTVPGVVAVLDGGVGNIYPADPDSEDAYPAKAAKRLPATSAAPLEADATKWLTAKALEWAQFLKPRTE